MFYADTCLNWEAFANVVRREHSTETSSYKASPFVSARTFNDKESLRQLLIRFKDCDCSDDRDRIFALLSLLKADERAALGQYFPDYSLSMEAVVVISLAHIRRFSDDYWNLRFDLLFQSLGVTGDLKRMRLLLATKMMYHHPGFAQYAGKTMNKKNARLLDNTMQRHFERSGWKPSAILDPVAGSKSRETGAAQEATDGARTDSVLNATEVESIIRKCGLKPPTSSSTEGAADPGPVKPTKLPDFRSRLNRWDRKTPPICKCQSTTATS